MSGFKVHGGGSGGGGAGTGLVEWGPDFGNDPPTTAAGIELRPYGWRFDLLTDRAAIDLVALAIAGDMEARAKVELNFGFVMSQMIAQGAVDLSSLDLSTDLKPQTAISGAAALELAQLNTESAIAASQMALLADAETQALIDLYALALFGGAEVGVELTANLLTAYDANEAQAATDIAAIAIETGLVPVTAVDGSIVMSALNVNAQGQIEHTIAPLFTPVQARSAAFLSRYDTVLTVWATAVGTATGFSGAGANYIDTNVASTSNCSAASSGIGGITSNTTNGNLRVAHADWSGTFSAYTLDTVSWLHRFGAVTAGTQILPGSHSMISYYSINDGTGWTQQETFTTLTDPVNRNIDLTSVVDTWAKVDGFRTRWEGSVTSGTGNGKSQTFKAYYTALAITAHRTF